MKKVTLMLMEAAIMSGVVGVVNATDLQHELVKNAGNDKFGCYYEGGISDIILTFHKTNNNNEYIVKDKDNDYQKLRVNGNTTIGAVCLMQKVSPGVDAQLTHVWKQ